jgi:hypothetical protein
VSSSPFSAFSPAGIAAQTPASFTAAAGGRSSARFGFEPR